MEKGDLPEAVRLPDGRTEPFEPERITRTLFAAGEQLGQADAFLARELTDGVLHFLLTEDPGPVLSAEQIAHVVGKVVRELGHPALARAYDDREASRQRVPEARPPSTPVELPAWHPRGGPPAALHLRLAHERLRASSLGSSYPRDLVSAHEEGLLQLTGLEYPTELEGVVAPLAPGRVLEGMETARSVAGGFVAVDGPEYDLAAEPGDPGQLADEVLRESRFAARSLGLTILLNLNARTAPPRLSEPSGPLFAGVAVDQVERRRAIAEALAARASDPCFDVWWHVAADGPGGADPPPSVVERAVTEGRTEFVFDRSRSPVLLGPGVDRQCSAALIRVGVNLARLVELMGGPPVDPEVFVRKVGSLTRFAKTAGHVKQDLLRRHGRPAVREVFLVDRARLVLAPTGLGAAARAADRAPVEFAREVLRAIRVAAETDRPRTMPVRVDVTAGDDFVTSAVDPGTGVRPQIRAAAQLHSVTGAGRLDLAGPVGTRFEDSAAADTIRAAAESGVPRLRFVPPGD